MSTVSVSDFNDLIRKVCTVYGRPIFGDNNLDYDGCNNDFFENLLKAKSKMFFLNTNTAATAATNGNITTPEGVLIYLVCYNQTKREIFTLTEIYHDNGKLLYNNVSGIPTTIESSTSGDTITYTIKINNVSYTISEDGTAVTTGDNTSYTLMKDGFNMTLFSDKMLDSGDPYISDNFSAFINNLPSDPIVIDSSISYAIELPSNFLCVYETDYYKSISHLNVYGPCSFYFIWEKDSSHYYEFEIEVSEISSGKIKGQLWLFGAESPQDIEVPYSFSANNKLVITFDYENGFDGQTACTLYSILAFRPLPIAISCKDDTDMDIRELLFYTKKPSGGECLYIEDVSTDLIGEVSAYSKFNRLYTSESDRTLANNNFANRVFAILLKDGSTSLPVLYIFGEQVHYYYIDKSDSELKQNRILEKYVTISDKSCNIERSSAGKSSLKYTIRSDDNTQSDSDCIYTFTDKTISFTNLERLPELSYNVPMVSVGDGSAKIIQTINSGPGYLGMFSGYTYLCTFKLYSLFVSNCMDTSPKFLVDSAHHPYTISDNNKYTVVEDYKLSLYNNDAGPTNFSPIDEEEEALKSTTTTKLYGMNNWTSDHIVYIRVEFTNIDAVKINDTTTKVYFDTDATYDDTRYMFFILDGSKKDNDGKVSLYIVSQEGTVGDDGIPTTDPTLRRYTCKVSDEEYLELTDISWVDNDITKNYPDSYISFGDEDDDILYTNIRNDIFPPNASYFETFNVMAVYDKIESDDPPTSTISLYTNKFYLEDGEFDDTGYSDNLLAKISASSKADLTSEKNLKYSDYSYYYVSYSVKNRLFTVRYHLESAKIKDITLFRFTNRANAKLEEIGKIEMDTTYTETYKMNDEDSTYADGFDTSSLKLDITINFNAHPTSPNPMYSITYENAWYNYVEGADENTRVTMLAFIGADSADITN